MDLSNKIDDITSLLRETAESNKSMGEEMHKIRIAQENMTKSQKSSGNNPFEGIKPPTINDDDMAKAKAQNDMVRKTLKGDRETQEQRSLREEKEYKTNLLKAQTTTNQYLKTLTALQEMAKKPQTDTLMGQIGSMYTGTSDYLKNSRFQTMQGIGGLMQTGGKVVSGIKKAVSIPSMWEDYRDKKSMDKSQRELKKQQAILAAREHKLRTNKKLSDQDKEKLLEQISAARKSADVASSEYSKHFSNQYVKLKKKTDKGFRRLDSETTGDLKQHIRDNLFDRMSQETKFLQRSKSANYANQNPFDSSIRASYIDVGGITSNTGFNRRPSLINEGNGLSSKSMESQTSIESAHSQRLLDLMFGKKINESASPKTYGEYVSGIYRQLKHSNEFLDKIRVDIQRLKGSAQSQEVDSGKNGIISTIGSMVGSMLGKTLGGIGGLITRGLVTALPAIASVALPVLGVTGAAASGLYIGDKIADMTGMHDSGASMSDVGAGVKGMMKGNGFRASLDKSMETRVADKETQHQIDSQKEKFQNSLKLGGGSPHVSLTGIPTDILADMTNDEKTEIFDMWLGSTLLNTVPRSVYNSKKKSIMKSVMDRIDESDVANTEMKDILSKRDAKKGGSPTNMKSQTASSTQPTMAVQTTISSVSGSLGRDQLTAMQMQAKLIASEMMLMQQNPKYIEQQNKFAKESGNSFAGQMFGG